MLTWSKSRVLAFVSALVAGLYIRTLLQRLHISDPQSSWSD
jgi:hypothetical protein